MFYFVYVEKKRFEKCKFDSSVFRSRTYSRIAQNFFFRETCCTVLLRLLIGPEAGEKSWEKKELMVYSSPIFPWAAPSGCLEWGTLDARNIHGNPGCMDLQVPGCHNSCSYTFCFCFPYTSGRKFSVNALSAAGSPTFWPSALTNHGTFDVMSSWFQLQYSSLLVLTTPSQRWWMNHL